MKEKLRVGLLSESENIPLWAYRLVENIMQSDFAEIKVVVYPEEENSPADSIGCWQDWLLSVYLKIDKSFNKLSPDAFELKNLQGLGFPIPRVRVRTIRNVAGISLSEEDCEQLRGYELDVLIDVNLGIIKGNILSCARCGIWSYQHSQLSALREVLTGHGKTTAALKVSLAGCDQEIILYRAYEQTIKLSVCSYMNNNHWKTSSCLFRRLYELSTLGRTGFFENVRSRLDLMPANAAELGTSCNILGWISLVYHHLKKIGEIKIKKLIWFEQYILLINFENSAIFSLRLAEFKKIIPSRDRFWADPFIVYEGGIYYIFVEEVIFPSRRGHISYISLDANGQLSPSKIVIQQPYHMSYPFIFQYNGEYYMIPETSANRTIELYKCIGFPDKWELTTILMRDIVAFDATVLFRDGQWWLFANISENEGTPSNDELFLYYTDDLFSGNWTPHQKNPIISDVNSARPAGKFFYHEGKLFRSSQNSSKRYGYGLKINQIVTLSETEYKEECVSSIEPYWDKKIIAVHTFNAANEVTVIDGLMKRARRPSDLLSYVQRRWHSLNRH